MNMVIILLMFTRAERSGNSQMHKSAFLAMLLWFAHYDHTNYMRWGTVYATDVNLLKVSHPDVHRQFMDGNFVVKSTHKTFYQIKTDLALEHVNNVGKVAGGLPGITRSDSAKDKWCLTYNERSRLVDETSFMFGLMIGDAEYAPSGRRLLKDQHDVQKLVDQLERFSVFNAHCPDLTYLATRDIARESSKLLCSQLKYREKTRSKSSWRLGYVEGMWGSM